MFDDLLAEANANKKKKIADKNVNVNAPSVQKQTTKNVKK